MRGVEGGGRGWKGVVSIALTPNVLKRYFYCQIFFYINTSVSNTGGRTSHIKRTGFVFGNFPKKHPKGTGISIDRRGSNIFLPLRDINFKQQNAKRLKIT